MESGGTESPGAVLFSTARSRTRGLLRGLILVLDHHDAPQCVIDSFRTQMTTYLDCQDENVFSKRAKYLTVAPMGDYLRAERPKAPDVIPMFSGAWKRWSRPRLRVFNRKNTHLWYSFLQGKRAALPLSDVLVSTTYEEHRESMSREDPLKDDDETYEGFLEEMEPVLDQVQRETARRYEAASESAYEDERSSYISRGEVDHAASIRACYEQPRSKGGQLGQLLHLAPALEHCNPRARTKDRVVPEFARMTFYPFVSIQGRIHFNVVVEEYEYSDGIRSWKDAISGECVRYIGGVQLKATIQAVLEPLKVRVISKGEAVPYYVSKALQVAMLSTLREMECFRLVGRPMTAPDLLDLARNPVLFGQGPLEWFSVDYSAATDRLSARLSAAILERITRGLDPVLQEIWASVLAPHWCRYPFPYSEKIKPVSQRNGQLMGSILSFPILCLANLGLYLLNIRDDIRPLREKLRGVLVNGDDMLYVAPRSLWDSHVALGERVGLSMSPGKAYHHSTYANVNSACYHYSLHSSTSCPHAIPFLNSGLYFGQNKVLGGDDVLVEKSFCATINPLLAGSLPSRRCGLLAAFVSRHKSRILMECGGRNLFISEGFGGLGIHKPRDFKTEVTTLQMQHAWRRWCLADKKINLFGEGPLGPSVPEPRAPHTPWYVPVLEGRRVRLTSLVPRKMEDRFRSLDWLRQPFRFSDLPIEADWVAGNGLNVTPGFSGRFLEYQIQDRGYIGSSALRLKTPIDQLNSDRIREEYDECTRCYNEYLQETSLNIAWLSLIE